jgi:hypothetical protein
VGVRIDVNWILHKSLDLAKEMASTVLEVRVVASF